MKELERKLFDYLTARGEDMAAGLTAPAAAESPASDKAAAC